MTTSTDRRQFLKGTAVSVAADPIALGRAEVELRGQIDDDLLEGRVYADAVVHRAWFLIDIHNPKGGGQAEGHSHLNIEIATRYLRDRDVSRDSA